MTAEVRREYNAWNAFSFVVWVNYSALLLAQILDFIHSVLSCVPLQAILNIIICQIPQPFTMVSSQINIGLPLL
jgi:hypothetical protein